MIDPSKVTNYQATDWELEELILFCCSVAGKNAFTTAKVLNGFLDVYGYPEWRSPFACVRVANNLAGKKLGLVLRNYGFGCYGYRAKTFSALAESGINLKTCTIEELKQIPGIGDKTARYFILHTRENCGEIACLDRHILRHLSVLGYNVPSNTPSGKRYLELEQVFVAEWRKTSFPKLADYDLDLWNRYSGNKDVYVG